MLIYAKIIILEIGLKNIFIIYKLIWKPFFSSSLFLFTLLIITLIINSYLIVTI